MINSKNEAFATEDSKLMAIESLKAFDNKSNFKITELPIITKW